MDSGGFAASCRSPQQYQLRLVGAPAVPPSGTMSPVLAKTIVTADRLDLAVGGSATVAAAAAPVSRGPNGHRQPPAVEPGRRTGVLRLHLVPRDRRWGSPDPNRHPSNRVANSPYLSILAACLP